MVDKIEETELISFLPWNAFLQDNIRILDFITFYFFNKWLSILLELFYYTVYTL